ncbi:MULTISPECIES: hypothetical protein [Nostoc]|uniref:Uncharacterized protein n=1 Tax=Nostoc paludosum FACHB-159 TaxID=2692908 RepID=A0ABR8KB51_9NOSO|nr:MULTISPECIES: hypothetical protein [Nostoc]MBD2735458.1 hypothetical protein [Nostoc paludosum FACHB-159]
MGHGALRSVGGVGGWGRNLSPHTPHTSLSPHPLCLPCSPAPHLPTPHFPYELGC